MTDSQQTPQGLAELQQDFIHEEQRGYTPAEDTEAGYRKPTLTFKEAVKTCLLEKYCCFKGRARRSELWWFQLMVVSVLAAFYVAIAIFVFFSSIKYENGTIYHYGEGFSHSTEIAISVIYCIILLALLLPSMGVITRRLHDIGKSGWYLGGYILTSVALYVGNLVYILSVKSTPFAFSIYIPILSLILEFALCVWFTTLLCKDGERNDNKYGSSPKYVNEYHTEYARISRPFEFVEAIKTCIFDNYVNFKGRTRRSEFWWYQLFLIVLFITFFLLNPFFRFLYLSISNSYDVPPLIDILFILTEIALLLPSLGATVRRLHDVGKSGTLYGLFITGVIIVSFLGAFAHDSSTAYLLRIIFFICLALGIYILVMLCRDSQPEENDWGPSPKYDEE